MLGDVLTSLLRRPVTERYPFERQPVPSRLRGKVLWDGDKCVGCGRCVKDCPSEALDLHVLDRKAKRFVMHYFLDRCLYCAQCNKSCPTEAIYLSNEEWELAALSRDPFDIYYGKDEDVKAVLEGTAGSDPSTDSDTSEDSDDQEDAEDSDGQGD